MALQSYKKYKISLNPDSKKVQGIVAGDIVRRQYFDGAGNVYSLMVALSSGTDEISDASGTKKKYPYFIGGLLEGNIPQKGELLDFFRITNLFDSERSGALYMTASDDDAPYLDVIDGMGNEKSLCWPVSVGNNDSVTQYNTQGSQSSFEYIKSVDTYNRVCHITMTSGISSFTGISQDFYQYVKSPERVVVSFKAKASRSLVISAVLQYTDGARTDGSSDVQLTTEWGYHVYVFSVDYSGRFLRTLKLGTSSGLLSGDEIWISDLNIILQSDISGIASASKARVGKIDGITDSVFGKLKGYGGYMQKLYASKSVHISGTLTAGDENGFGATFYAGKIHRNCFINSISPAFGDTASESTDVQNPTGIGNVYKSAGTVNAVSQIRSWLDANVGKRYNFSFWVYAKKACELTINQNGKYAGLISVATQDTQKWMRVDVSYLLLASDTQGEDMILSIVPAFSTESDMEQEASIYYITAPQLESGTEPTQYQPTDNVLNFTEAYGAWFSEGGIGGTPQNPLIRLNMDGQGSIGARTGAFLYKQDGSGYTGCGNIVWDKEGNVSFGEKVKLSWTNFDNNLQNEVAGKNVKIIGKDTFTFLGDASGKTPIYYPQTIEVEMNALNMEASQADKKWYYLARDGYKLIEGKTEAKMALSPEDAIWEDTNALTLKAVMTESGKEYVDTFTVKKEYIVGFSVKLISSKGTAYKNGVCSTVLNAEIYYQGKRVDDTYAAENFTFLWQKFHLPDTANEVADWWKDAAGNEIIDRTKISITLDYKLTDRDKFVFSLLPVESVGFDYKLPIVFA